MQRAGLALQNAFLAAKSRNPGYSKRAFAKRLGLSPGALVEVMSGKRKISAKLASRLEERLGLAGLAEPSQIPSAVPRSILPLDQFEAIADLNHFRVLKSTQLSKPPKSLDQLAELLGLAPAEAERVVNRLVRLGYLKPRSRGGWERTVPPIDTPAQISSPAIRSAHRQSTESAFAALDMPAEEREFTLTFELGSPEQLPALRELIRRFQDEAHGIFAKGPKKKIYQLNVQLFPVSEVKK
jgi:plasmid maintenance system antidote protein VapI